MNRNENSLSCETKSDIIKFIQSHKFLSLPSLNFPQPLSHPSPPPSHFLKVLSSLYTLPSLPLPLPCYSHKVSSFSQKSSPSYRPPSLSLRFSHGYLIFLPHPRALQPSLSISLPSPPHSHMASWFSQDIADSSSSSDSLLEGGDEAHEQCVTAWLHEHRPVVHLHSLHLLTLYAISCTHTMHTTRKQNMFNTIMSYIVSVISNLEC